MQSFNTNIVQRVSRFVLSCVQAFEADSAEIFSDRGTQDNTYGGAVNYLHAAHCYLALYLTPSPANPLAGRPEVLAAHLKLVDRWVDRWTKSMAAGKPEVFSEWPIFLTARSLELLGNKVSGARRRRWIRMLVWWIEQRLPRPFLFTAPNHEAWRLAATLLAARILQRPAWREIALFQARQLLAYQTSDGFWEEGRHHGPSMKYNSLMLGGLTAIVRETGDREFQAAAERLARFMIDWSFPDGVLVGAFDGRQSSSPGYFGLLAPGLDFAPGGLAHCRRILEFWERAGWLGTPRAVGPSNWYAYFGMAFAGEALLHYRQCTPRAKGAGRLRLDRPQITLERHSAHFDGLIARRKKWTVALSSQISDLTKECPSIYRLERQNRIELWHERASLVVGGGHSLITARQPLYNAWVDSGFAQDADNASLYDNPNSLAARQRRAIFCPRAISSGAASRDLWIELVFAHATVRFELKPRGDEVAIHYRYRSVGLRELRVCLPLVLWRTARAFADGREVPAPRGALSPAKPFAATPVRSEVAVDTPLFGTRATLRTPSAGKTRVLWPLWPVRSYDKLFPDERFTSFFSIALVETVLARPGKAGEGEWRLRVK